MLQATCADLSAAITTRSFLILSEGEFKGMGCVGKTRRAGRLETIRLTYTSAMGAIK